MVWQDTGSATEAVQDAPAEVKGTLHMHRRLRTSGLSELQAGLRQEHAVMTGANVDGSQGRHSEETWSQIVNRSVLTGVARVSSKRTTRYRSIGRNVAKSRAQVRNK